MKITPSRKTAYDILLKIERHQAFSSVLLAQAEDSLNQLDRALAHALTLGTLRKKLYLDRLIEKLSGKKVKKLDLEVLVSIRIGLYQILFLDKIPPSAAVNESVNLVQQAKKSSAKGFVNAILRRATREQINPTENIENEIEKISIATSHPIWLLEKWIKDFGIVETKKLAEINNQTPKSVFRLTAQSDETTTAIVSKIGLEIVESEIVANAWVVSKTNEILRNLANLGKIYFQEESSQLVASLINLAPTENFWDVCAAPGSKATSIARQNVNSKRPHLLIAGDLYFHRLQNLKENCEKVGAQDLQIVGYNAENSVPFADETFDWILVDAPCSGTGTIRHNPEIRYSLKPEDFDELSKKQLKILNNASKTLKTGGRLVYSTCSLEREENEDVVERFLLENKNFQKVLPDLPRQFLTSQDFARTFPTRDQTDGFFIAMLIKK
jgi:16S rRNA (cytosine967-C5)-methyltransferase